MPRTARAARGGLCYHVINRGNARNRVFHSYDDYDAFLQLFHKACARVEMRVLAYCLMPNHFHFCLWPREDSHLRRFMHWLLTSHVARHRKAHKTTGHIWQGRFKAFPAQSSEHLLTVLRYIERNPVRAKLCTRAEDWQWSSARLWVGSGSFSPAGGEEVHDPLSLAPERAPKDGDGPSANNAGDSPLSHGPVKRPADWLAFVRIAENSEDLAALRASVNKGTPFGSERWVKLNAPKLGLVHTTRLRGRPRKSAGV